MRFHKSLKKKCGAHFTFVLQYSLSEQVRNEREPFTTMVTQCGSYVKVRYKSSATKGEKKNSRTIKTVTKL